MPRRGPVHPEDRPSGGWPITGSPVLQVKTLRLGSPQPPSRPALSLCPEDLGQAEVPRCPPQVGQQAARTGCLWVKEGAQGRIGWKTHAAGRGKGREEDGDAGGPGQEASQGGAQGGPQLTPGGPQLPGRRHHPRLGGERDPRLRAPNQTHPSVMGEAAGTEGSGPSRRSPRRPAGLGGPRPRAPSLISAAAAVPPRLPSGGSRI